MESEELTRDMMLLDTEKLASISRGGYEEIALRGELVVVDGEKEIFASREERGYFPARSTLKPFQFLAANIPMHLWEGEERYAASTGSTYATEYQTKKLREWSQARKELVPHLKLPRSFPSDDAHRAELKKTGESQSQIFHMCFSKHMGILEGCQRNGWPLGGYLETNHPYQVNLRKLLSELIGRQISESEFVTDGCLLPTPSISVRELASLYQKLASGATEPLAKVRDLMLANPNWIAGPSSPDTELMIANPGRVIAKTGADGLMALGILPTKGKGDAIGVVVKLDLGFQPARTMLALEPVMKHYDLTPAHSQPRGQEITFHYDLRRKSQVQVFDITPTLRPNLGLFPGEVPFCRNVSLDTEKGDVITLSSIETTLHAGAHTDAPNHFAKGAQSIDLVDVRKYVGPCQVIHVVMKPKESIRAEHIRHLKIKAPRVLFRTDSYPDETKFEAGFASLSADVINFLGEQGVVLVGIDTPSIDAASSKTLDAHHATLKWNMGILENIRLAQVEEGLYSLVATPLKIVGGDASPVRAILLG